jgi:hypothetical protein
LHRPGKLRHASAVFTRDGDPGGAMSFHARRRNHEGIRNADSSRAGGNATGRMGARWDGSVSRASTGGTMPRLGAVLLAFVVVALLTIGLHVLFQ